MHRQSLSNESIDGLKFGETNPFNVKKQINQLEQHSSDKDSLEPIAIIGMSCRFPLDTNTPDKFWKLLIERRTTTSQIPEWRWQPYRSSAPKILAALDSATRFGSFLSNIDGFDADFFGITPREAELIDPQQRMVLELSWEALENAGIAPSSLKGLDVGVYIAANSFDFGHLLMANLADIQPWTVNGGMLFGIANRVSYALDFRGPSMVVDTACAGSLTTLHLACQALRCKEVPLAIVGGVNIMSNPGMMIALDAAGATAPDGKSKTFDKSANGYGRGEGAGIVILKRLSEAQEAGDQILAVVKGSSIFQDGRTAGMMAPNPKAQEIMLRKTYERYGISPHSVSYVEAHGTGTPAGDKAEVSALVQIFGNGRPPENPCLIGSAKPNVGHLEAGAGMAGLIKTVLSMRHGVLPPSVYNELNAEIDWKNSGIKVVSEPTPWPSSGHPRRAGISCFGVGGTISHAILEEAPIIISASSKNALVQPTIARPLVFPLSARSNGALKEVSSNLADWIEAHPQVGLNSIANTLSRHRDHLSKRAVVIGTTHEDVVARLRKIASSTSDPLTITGECRIGAEKGTVWVFSGHGSQWSGMAVELLENEAPFAEVIDELGPIFKEELGYTARTAILESDWSTIERIQAITFATQLGLATLWRRNGLQPSAVIGHSVGEVAAAVVAGVLDMKEAARFACRRAAIYQRLAGHGGMALARLSFDEAQQRLMNNTHISAAIAASPEATVISGDIEALNEIASLWKRERIAVKKLTKIDAAFHSGQIDALIPDIKSAAKHLITHKPIVRLYTTTLSDPRSLSDRGPEFWAANSRSVVRLMHAVEAAMEDGFTSFLEISTAPIVTSSIRETADLKQRDDITICATLNPNQPEVLSITSSLAMLFCNGINFDWSALYPSPGFVDLPTMAWQHRSFWPTTAITSSERGFGHAPTSHTLLGQAEHIGSTPPFKVWRTNLDFNSRPYPGRHPIFGVEIVPAAALLYSLMKAGSRNDTLSGLIDISLHTPVPVDNPLELQIVLQNNTLRISSKLLQDQSDEESLWEWTTHTTALIDTNDRAYTPHTYDLNELQLRCNDVWSWERIESLYRKRGIGDYGFLWHLIDLRRGDGEIIASFKQRETSTKSIFTWAEIFDAALTVCPLLLPDDEVLRMPSHIDHITIHGQLPKEYIVHASRADKNNISTGECYLQVHILNIEGQEIAIIDGLKFGVLDNKAELRNRPTDIIFSDVWRSIDLPGNSESLPRSMVFVGQRLEWLRDLADTFSNTGISCDFVDQADSLGSISDCMVVVVGSMLDSGEQVEEASERNAWSLIETAQTLIANASNMKNVRLCCLTQDVRMNKNESSLAQSPLWGVARIIAGERPDLWGGLFDLDTSTPIKSLGSQLHKAMLSRSNEDVISISKEGTYVLRLVSATHLPSKHAAASKVKSSVYTTVCHADATYLVTGGFGALGLEAARYLISMGARRLILAGRHGLPERRTWKSKQDPTIRNAIDSIKEMETAGVTVIPLQIDISNPESVREKLNSDALGLPSIRGIVHAAGVFDGGILSQIDRRVLRSVLQSKIRGTMALHRQFPPGSLDFFVLFSSSGQLGRLTGQACYAAANAFLDGFARYRNTSGVSDSISLGWMAWRGMGMSKSIDATMIEARSQGMEAIESASALNAWRYCNQLSIDYAAIFALSNSQHNPTILPVFSELFNESDENTSESSTSFDIPVENRLAWLVADIRKLVATELKVQEENIEVKRPLIEMGVDSLMTVSLRVRFKQRYGFEFPATLLWNNPSVYAIANFIEQHLNELSRVAAVDSHAHSRDEACSGAC